MATPLRPTQNHLLAALPAAKFKRLSPHLGLVPMPLGEALYESGTRLGHVYFPTTSIVSLLYVLADGASAEIAVVGNEGILGISLFMGGETTPSRALVQSAIVLTVPLAVAGCGGQVTPPSLLPDCCNRMTKDQLVTRVGCCSKA
jgi:hypothetical protein